RHGVLRRRRRRARRLPRDRRRAGPRRHGPGADPGRGPRPGLRGGRSHLVAGHAASAGHRPPRARIDRVIPRYELPEMAALFADSARFQRWLDIELLAVDAWADLGVVPMVDAAACRAAAPTVDDAFVRAVDEREQVTDHDVASFVDVVQAAIGEPGRWVHYGLTSSDV